MAGRPNRSGGWNKLTPEEHRQRGTRPRVKPRPARVHAAVVPITDPVPEAVIEGLQGPGKAFAEATWKQYTRWSAPELMLLRQAARLVDDAESGTNPRARQSAIRLLAALVAQLRLEPLAPAAAPNPLDKFINRSKWSGVLK